jgi:hypothetical protein
MSDGTQDQPVALLVADADIQSGVWRTDPRGLSTDSFVLQGGDPWGFYTDHAFNLSQADGVYVFAESVPEPGSAALLATGLTLALVAYRRQRLIPGAVGISSPSE